MTNVRDLLPFNRTSGPMTRGGNPIVSFQNKAGAQSKERRIIILRLHF